MSKMYDELVKRLRSHEGWALNQTLDDAANAIEEMQCAERKFLHNISNLESQIDQLKREREWIPVIERLPENGKAVNVVWVNHSPVIYYQNIKDKPQTATGVYYQGKWYWWSAVVQDYLAEYGQWDPDKMDAAIEVTHWMPLPEPPIIVAEEG